MVAISFYLLSVVAVAMLFLLFRSYSLKKVARAFIGICIGWISYLILLTQIGVLRDFSLPPRVPLLIVLPAILLIILLINRPFMKEALHNTPSYHPIALQSFRIFVELSIYATYLQGIFPQKATFEGLNFDIVVGISALLMGLGVYKRIIGDMGILIWNVLSLGILSLTVFAFISSYYFSDIVDSEVAYQFVEFPYLLLASVLLPIAIFLHVFSIKQVMIRKSGSFRAVKNASDH